MLTYLSLAVRLLKLLVVQRFKNFLFRGVYRFITIFTKPIQWNLSWATSKHSTQCSRVSSKIHFKVIHIPTHIFQENSPCQGFRPEFCMPFLSRPCVPHAPPTSSSSLWPSYWCIVNTDDISIKTSCIVLPRVPIIFLSVHFRAGCHGLRVGVSYFSL